MPSGPHDTIARRLSQILIKLNQGEKLAPEALAEEFGVHLRTIQRDLKVRLACLPLTKRRGRYALDAAFLGKLTLKDIERFACLAGVKGLFPALSDDFLREIFDDCTQPVWLVKGPHYEDLSDAAGIFKQLEQAIALGRLVALEMPHEGKIKRYEAVAPYRLLNIKGIWYLAARHKGKYKTFGIGKLRRVDASDTPFEKDPAIEASIQSQEGVWHSDANQQVTLSVAAPAAAYFKRRALLPRQRITREDADGALRLTAEAGHANQILPVVRFWLPHVRIISPESWQDDLELGLRAYVSGGAGGQEHA